MVGALRREPSLPIGRSATETPCRMIRLCKDETFRWDRLLWNIPEFDPLQGFFGLSHFLRKMFYFAIGVITSSSYTVYETSAAEQNFWKFSRSLRVFPISGDSWRIQTLKLSFNEWFWTNQSKLVCSIRLNCWHFESTSTGTNLCILLTTNHET